MAQEVKQEEEQEFPAITIESLSTTDNYNTTQWRNTTTAIVKEAVRIERVETVSGETAKLSKKTRDYFDYL